MGIHLSRWDAAALFALLDNQARKVRSYAGRILLEAAVFLWYQRDTVAQVRGK